MQFPINTLSAIVSVLVGLMCIQLFVPPVHSVAQDHHPIHALNRYILKEPKMTEDVRSRWPASAGTKQQPGSPGPCRRSMAK